VLSPVTGIAAALLFAALGAGIMYATLSRAAGGIPAAGNTAESRSGPGAGATPLASTASETADREIVRFELSAPKAAHVTLVGSFNEWNPAATPLVRDAATGKWIVSLRLPPGRHVYAFVVDGDVTADPAAPRAADDDFGSANSVVLVSGRES
jgi:1,4-alpha-glucan branching enzyme